MTLTDAERVASQTRSCLSRSWKCGLRVWGGFRPEPGGQYLRSCSGSTVVLPLMLPHIPLRPQVDKPVYFNDFYMLTGTMTTPARWLN